MKRVVRIIGAVILAAAVLTMVLADIVLAAPGGAVDTIAARTAVPALVG